MPLAVIAVLAKDHATLHDWLAVIILFFIILGLLLGSIGRKK